MIKKYQDRKPSNKKIQHKNFSFTAAVQTLLGGLAGCFGNLDVANLKVQTTQGED